MSEMTLEQFVKTDKGKAVLKEANGIFSNPSIIEAADRIDKIAEDGRFPLLAGFFESFDQSGLSKQAALKAAYSISDGNPGVSDEMAAIFLRSAKLTKENEYADDMAVLTKMAEEGEEGGGGIGGIGSGIGGIFKELWKMIQKHPYKAAAILAPLLGGGGYALGGKTGGIIGSLLPLLGMFLMSSMGKGAKKPGAGGGPPIVRGQGGQADFGGMPGEDVASDQSPLTPMPPPLEMRGIGDEAMSAAGLGEGIPNAEDLFDLGGQFGQ